MKYLTLGTVLAEVACHTGTIIVIYFIRASCIVFARIRVTIIDIWEIKIHVKHGKFSTRNRGYFCKVKVWFTRKKIHFTIVIDHCVSSLRQVNQNLHDNITFFFTYKWNGFTILKFFFFTHRWNGQINDRTYFGYSSCLRSPPYNYTYSHLLRRHKLHRFRKDQGYNHWYLTNKDKCWTWEVFHSKRDYSYKILVPFIRKNIYFIIVWDHCVFS